LKFRLTILYVGIFAAFIVAFSIGVYSLASSRGWKDFDRSLDRDAQVYASLVLEERREIETGEHTEQNWLEEVKGFPALMNASASLYSADGKVLFRTADQAMLAPRKSPSVPEGEAETRTEFLNLPHHPGEYRVMTMALRDGNRPVMVLEFSRSTAGLARFLNRMKLGLIAGVPSLMLLAFIAGYLFVRRALKPVDQMAGLAREISAGDLARRIPLPASEGEFRQLALTFNAMLSRLEEAFARMRTFTSNAAHELKTPVATVRSALETSLGRSPKEMEESIHDALEELGSLTVITEKLFLLARADSGRLLGPLGPIDLAEIAAQVAGAFEGPAAARKLSLRLETVPVQVKADAALIRRAIHNLVDNAVKYGKDGGEVAIRVGPGGVEVRNDGPPLLSEQMTRLFDRFYRADASRSDRVPGSGLGLAIVKAIVEAHGGTVRAESDARATTFFISLPGASAVRPAAVPAG
jgi:heavy metal sensor kinase